MRVLLVDHDSEGLEAVARAIRGVLELDCVTSKGDAMLLLRQNAYDVLIACERCVDGSGLDLLGRTTRTTAPLKRIFAAPADRLQLLGPRLAPFKVQRTISYPIDLEELWLAIAQVTGTNDDTDGTIERVVLDERGIPANGSTPRVPIPPRPPAPLRELRPGAAALAPVPAAIAPPMSATPAARGARTAAARVAQPLPDPPPRAPAPSRPLTQVRAPAAPSDTGRMRALPATSDTGRMRALQQPPPAPREEPAWTPEPVEEDFAQVAEQARLGVQRKQIDEAARRKRQRLLTAGAVAAVVAGVIVFLIEKFYDPEARARERAIAEQVSRMAEQQKVTDNLTLIEVDIEKAIMENNLDLAREELARLVEHAPEHPRREFLQASIDRAAELARLAAQKSTSGETRESAGSEEAEETARVQSAPRPAERATQRDAARERLASRRPPAEHSTSAGAGSSRSFGAPIGDAPGQRVIPLDAPINAEPTLAPQHSGTSFGGRTIEASDSTAGNPAAPAASIAGNAASAGSATAVPPPASAPAPAPSSKVAAAPEVEVIAAKILKRVAPVAPNSVSARTGGYVVLQYTVAENGRVTDVEVVESSPRGVFDGAAQAAVRKWTYEPRKENGVAVASVAKARVVFEPAN